jgi:hypothetical protein
VVVEFVVGCADDAEQHQHCPDHSLRVGEEKDEKEEAFEVQLLIGLDAEGVGDS